MIRKILFYSRKSFQSVDMRGMPLQALDSGFVKNSENRKHQLNHEFLIGVSLKLIWEVIYLFPSFLKNFEFQTRKEGMLFEWKNISLEPL